MLGQASRALHGTRPVLCCALRGHQVGALQGHQVGALRGHQGSLRSPGAPSCCRLEGTSELDEQGAPSSSNMHCTAPHIAELSPSASPSRRMRLYAACCITMPTCDMRRADRFRYLHKYGFWH